MNFWQKWLHIMLTAVLAFSLLSPVAAQPASAEEVTETTATEIDVQLKVDGLQGEILGKTSVKVEEGVTALDVLKKQLDQATISYKVVESNYGPYVTAINELAADSTHGWMYTVNGQEPEVGMASYNVQANDVVRVYYIEYPPYTAPETIEPTADVAQEIEKLVKYFEKNQPDFVTRLPEKLGVHTNKGYSNLENQANFLLGLRGAGKSITAFPWTVDEYYSSNAPLAEGRFWTSATLLEHKAVENVDYTNALLGEYTLEMNPYDAFGHIDIYTPVSGSQYTSISASGQFHSSANRTIKNNVRTLLAINAMDRVPEEEFNANLTLKYLLKQQYSEATGLFASDLAETGWAMIALGQYPTILNGEESLDGTLYEVSPLTKTIAYVKEQPALLTEATTEALAVFISGLVAIGEDPTAAVWPVGANGENMSLVDYLVSQQKDGSYGSEEADLAVLIALGDVQAKATIFERLKTLKNITRTVQLKVEGPTSTLFDDTVTLESYPTAATLEQIVKKAVPTIDLTEANGNAKWYYTENMRDIATDFSVAAQNNQQLTVYYGARNSIVADSVAIEDITLTNGIEVKVPDDILAEEPFTIEVQAKYNKYKADGKSIETDGYEVPQTIAGATVTFNGDTYTTNAKGIVEIPGEKAKVGTYELTVSKDIEGSYPRMLRQAKKVIVQEDETPKKDIRVVVEGPTGKLHDVTVNIKENKSVYDATIQAFKENNIPYKASTTLVSEIAGISSVPITGGWDGWNFTTNTIVYSENWAPNEPLAGVTDIIWYYGAEGDLYQGAYGNSLDENMTVKPFVNVVGEAIIGQEVILNVTAQHRIFDASGAKAEEKHISPLAGTTITVNGEKYVTDTLGNVTIPAKHIQFEQVAMEVSHFVENSYPKVVRTDVTITAKQSNTTAAQYRALAQQAIEKGQAYLNNNAKLVSDRTNESHSGYWMLSTMTALGVDVQTFPWTTKPTDAGTHWTTMIDEKAADKNSILGTVIGANLLALDATNIKGRDYVADLASVETAAGMHTTIYAEPWAMVARTLQEDKTYDYTKHLRILQAMQSTGTGMLGTADITGWWLIALAPYKEDPEVKAVIDKAVAAYHTQFQKSGFVNNSNTMASIISGLASVGEDVFSEKWTYEKDGKQVNIVGKLVEDYVMADGGVRYLAADKKSNLMAVEQVYLALGDAVSGKSTFVRFMEDRKKNEGGTTPPTTPGENTNGDGGTTPPTTPEDNTGGNDGTTPPTQPGDTTGTTPTVEKVSMSIAKSATDVVLPSETFEILADETAFDFLKRVTKQKNISLNARQTSMGMYVVGIAGLNEFDKGPYSGWMYSVNGVFPEVSANNYKLKAGDNVKWVYTTNLGTDVGDPSAGGSTGSGSTGNSGTGSTVTTPPVTEEPKEEPKDEPADGEEPATEEPAPEKPEVNLEVSADALEKESTVTLHDGAGTNVVVPSASVTLAADEKLVATIEKTDNKIQVDLTVVAQDGSSKSINTGKPYAAISFDIAEKNAVILQLVNGKYEAVPHTIVDGKVTILTKTGGTFVVSTDVVTFTDIADLYNKDEIEFLANRHIIKGSDGDYMPYKNITRGQFAMMIARALGLEPTANNPFTDTVGKEYEQDVLALFEAGITTGNTETTFNPSAPITRQQAAALMGRVLDYMGVTGTGTALPNYTDIDVMNPAFAQHIALLAELDIMTGKPDGSFNPRGYLTRGQMAKILKRTLNAAGLM